MMVHRNNKNWEWHIKLLLSLLITIKSHMAHFGLITAQYEQTQMLHQHSAV